MKARKKPVVIEYMPADITGEETISWPKWLMDACIKHADDLGAVWFDNDSVYVRSKEGVVCAPKDKAMIMQGVKGEIYLCDAEIFAQTYEALDG